MHYRRSAMTLIEVLAGLLILSFLLVAVLQAQKANVEQISKAETTLRAVNVADKLLEEWHSGDSQVPQSGNGEVDGFRWSTKIQNQSGPFGTAVVRLQIHHTLDSGSSEIESDSSEDAPILAVDIFVPNSQTEDTHSTN